MVAGGGSLLVFLLSLLLYFGLIATGSAFGDVAHPQWAVNEPWINTNIGGFHFQINYALGTDGLSMPLIILNALLTFLAVVSSWRPERRPQLYIALLPFPQAGVSGGIARLRSFLFILFWGVELIPMFLLIGIWGGARREYAAWKFLLFTLVGSSFTLAGIFLLYIQTGSVNALYQFLATAGPKVSGSLPLFGGAI